MKQFQDIGKEIADLRKPLRWYGFGGVALNTIILLISFWVNFGDRNQIPYSTVESCYYGMKNIFSNSPSKELVNEKVIKSIAKGKINFDFEHLHLVKYIDGYHCDVVAKDPNGFRSFLVSLEKNSKYKHLYRILDVQERQLVSEYQK